MKYIMFLGTLMILAGCAHTYEQVVGYNEEGLTLVQVCKSYGDPTLRPDAYGSSCVLELRDYGRITNTANTVNIISNENR